MKRYLLIILLSCIFLLSGCGQGGTSTTPGPENSPGKEVEVNTTENEESRVDEEVDKTDKENLPALTAEPCENIYLSGKVPVNTREEEILYAGKDNIDPVRALHRCASDGENVFLAYAETDLYIMPVGADKHSRAGIDNPEKLVVCNVAVDVYGKVHLLMATPNYEEWYVWCLDEEYQTEKMMDVSAYFQTNRIPLWFLVDKDGTYYIQWIFDRNGIIVDKDGSLKHETTLQTLGLSWIYEAGVGNDGKIYLLYRKTDNKMRIGELDVETGTMGTKEVTFSFGGEEPFMTMSAGTDTTLLLFSPTIGVWACDIEKERLTNRVSLPDIGFPPSMDYWPLTFIPDGRLLTMASFAEEGLTKDEKRLMKYIPAGK